jgi:hypothetical protein
MTLLVMTPLDEEFTFLERSITVAGYLSKSVRVDRSGPQSLPNSA